MNPLWKNAKDYGATGNGTTDDTAALQSAINAASDNETVFVPSGTYKISSSLTVSSGVRLYGAGSDPNWFSQSTVLNMVTANTSAINAATFEKDVGVEYLTILGPGSATSGAGIHSSSSVRMRGVHVRGFYDGVYIDDSLGVPPSSAFYNHIDRSWFMSNARSGVYLHTKTNNTSITESYFASAQYGLIADGGFYGLRVNNSSFEVHSVAGISIDGNGASQDSSAVYIAGCYFEQLLSGGSASCDITIGPGTKVYGVLIEGCFFVYSDITTLWHIILNKAQAVTISGSYIGSNAEAGAVKADVTNTSKLVLLNNYMPGATTGLPATTTII